ncbi:ADP-ribosylglycohydrolase [Paraoerskovia marina]|uniref:ADP-ribosylglycohydrolase n=1 Tax=Paraoerskovia marina TaxID=545619 RepID=A0A1H1NQK6_9CELL|nr:ADP-ribosylglycohydrolase family protein [Paraoerskovia marina]SDS01252.1 ADP-ribosylglycohydrolase [Paraoerskovia marina]
MSSPADRRSSHPADLDDAALLARAAGVLLTQACGDALGVPYEFAMPPAKDEMPVMRGGGLGPYEPGEWSDDTQMAICIARVTAHGPGGHCLVDTEGEARGEALDEIAEAFEAWRNGGASDIGTQTATVLRDAAHLDGPAHRRLTTAARALHGVTGKTAGNGALMRTGIVGLVALDDRTATARATRAVAHLTHADVLAAESCVLWGEAIRVAVTEERLDVRAGLDLLPAERADMWSAWIHDAEQDEPTAELRQNGFTVTALLAAWHAVHTTRDAEHHLVEALAAAVRIGGDTDTVAAIAGQLLGAYYGASRVPADWRAAVHGWPGMRADDLVDLAVRTARHGLERGPADGSGYAPESDA